MKFLIFIPCFTHGGAEKQASILAMHLKEIGHYVEVWGLPSRGKGTPLLELLTTAGITCRQLDRWPSFGWIYQDAGLNPASFLLRAFLRLLRNRKLCAELPRQRFDIVIPFTITPSVLTLLCRKQLGVRIFWNHRSGYDNGSFIYNRYFVRLATSANVEFVANSQDGAHFVADTFNQPLASVSIIPNAFVPDGTWKTLPTFERHRTNKRNTLRLLHLANLNREKDIWTALEAIRILKKDGSNVLLDIAGFTPFKEDERRLLEEISREDLFGSVRFCGPLGRAELEQWLIDADIGLLSTRCEGTSNSILEYMYARLPIIGTDIPGIRELLPEENRKWLFPVGDSEKLASLIQKMSESEELRMHLGAENCAHVERKFSMLATMQQWERVLKITHKAP
ncbi:MAG: glycosyltransferase family 4 protein [Candidatus Competibacteraceae bacterium]|nr:MAG: glycosyltransferase family 4 protein [Candidatus Competibacteraceae bacterium]